jgi:very-short-patch-repair endonuclease
MRNLSADRTCAELAVQQYGVLSRRQALIAGLTDEGIMRRLKAQEWRRLFAGVYGLPGAPDRWEQRLMAAVLHAGPGAVAARRAAGMLWELEGVACDVAEVSTPRHLRSTKGVRARIVEDMDRSDVAVRRSIPVTSAARTLVDLAGATSEQALEIALEDALRRGLTSVEHLAATLERLGSQGRRGAGRLRRLLEARGSGERPTESALETRLGRVIRKSALPRPVRQHSVWQGATFVARVDYAYPEIRLAVEGDGYRYHTGRAAWRRDLERMNALIAAGWVVLRFTWDDVVHRSASVVTEIENTLRLLTVKAS